jgi:hypothetical protein
MTIKSVWVGFCAVLLFQSPPAWAAGKRVTGEAFEEELEPALPVGGPLPGCRVLARFAGGPPPVGASPQAQSAKGSGSQGGPPAIVENTYGKGKAILVGTFLALAYERQRNDAAKQVLLAFVHAAGIMPEVTVTGTGTEQVEVRRVVSDRAEFLFAFNPSVQPADATIAVTLPWAVRGAHSINEDQAVSLAESAGQAVLRKKLDAGEVWVVRLDRK